MKITTDKTEYVTLWANTNFSTICLKEHYNHGDWNKTGHGRKFGRLSTPELPVASARNPAKFNELILKHEGEVVVLGYNDDPFVWRGTPQEFVEYWMVD